MRKIFLPALIVVFLTVIFLSSNDYGKRGEPKGRKGHGNYAGTEICQTCHEKVYNQLAKTPMGTLFLKHPLNEGEKLGCESCHGQETRHAGSGGKSFQGLIGFAKGAANAGFREKRCLSQVPSKEAKAFLVGQCSCQQMPRLHRLPRGPYGTGSNEEISTRQFNRNGYVQYLS